MKVAQHQRSVARKQFMAEYRIYPCRSISQAVPMERQSSAWKPFLIKIEKNLINMSETECLQHYI